MVLLFYTTYISVDLAHHEIFRAEVGKGGIITLAFLLKQVVANISPMINAKHLNFNIFGGFQTNEYYLEYEDFVDIFFFFFFFFLGGGGHKVGSFLCILESFLKVKVQIGGIFGDC